MENNKIKNNEDEIKESIQSTNVENQISKGSDTKLMNVIIEEKKPKKKDRRHSILKSITKNIPLFQIMKIKDRDLKNYDKISNEFNKIFKLFKKIKKDEEIRKLNSQTNIEMADLKKNRDKQNKKIDLNEVIQRLEIPMELRTIRDIYLIRKYLKTTHVASLFQNELKPKSELYNKLLCFLAFQMKYKKIKKNEILFKIGNRTDYFYLIMEGCVEILKPMSKIHKISGYEYFLELMNYRKRNERYLYSLCIRENLRNYEIKTKDGDLIPYIYITYKLEEIKNRYFVDFRTILELVNITPEELGLDPDKIHSNGYIFSRSKMIKLRMPIITQHELNLYRFLDDKVNKKEVILFQYEPFLKIGKNSFFGEASFSGKGVRNGTARIVEDCYFGYIDIQLYNLNFYEEKKAIFEKKVNFLYSNFFFGKISIRKFETHFFNWFISEEYKNNDLIYKENDPCHFIYFIEEGTIELTSSRTILEIQVLLEDLEERRISMKEKGEKKDYNNLNNDWFDIENHVNKNQINKILILGKNNVLGLESFYYQLPFITNARVITPKAKVVKIDIEHLYQILIRSSECMHELEIKVHNTIKIITNRFFSLNNVKLMLIDNKITREENLQYENHMREKKKELNLRVNSPFLEKKFEIVKKNKISNEIERRKNKLLSAMARAGTTKSVANFWDEYFEKNKKKDKEKKKKEQNKKRSLFDFLPNLMDSEDKFKKNRKLTNSAGASKKNKEHSFIMRNYASDEMEDNLLKKVRNEIKSLQENKFFLTKIKTEENEKKEEESDKEDNYFSRDRDYFMKKYNEKNKNKDKEINLSKHNNTTNDSKKKENTIEKGEFTFITKFEDNKRYNNIFHENENENKKIIFNNISNDNNNINIKKEITTSLPSIIKPFNNKNSFKSLSIFSRNQNVRSISIDNSNKCLKNLNINFRYNNHLIKSYSFINKNNGNYTRINQDLNNYDPKEKYNIFNENYFKKKDIYSNIRKINKLKGLNEFGFPLKASYGFIPRTVKKNDLNIKMKKYQDYRRRLQRKIEEINEIL